MKQAKTCNKYVSEASCLHNPKCGTPIYVARIGRKKWVELQVVLGLFLLTGLNTIIFTGISLGENTRYGAWGEDIAIILHVTTLIGMLVCIFMNLTKALKFFFYLLLFVLIIGILSNLYLLIVNPRISDNGTIILTEALLIWLLSLFVFTFWYWLVDRGGPISRVQENDDTRYDLLFPQYQSKIPGWEKWHPHVIDYLFFSFFTSTGFSPADTLPLTKRVKFLMMIEASISLIIIGMVAARAISLIQ